MSRKRIGHIYSKTGGRCWYCGDPLSPFSDWEIEHQIPRNQGGSNDSQNLVPACRRCNSRKGRRTVEQYRHALIAGLENRITAAMEYAGELSAAFGNDPSMWMPEPLLLIYDGLSDLANKATALEFRFFAESEALAIERIAAHQTEDRTEGVQ